MGNSNSLNHQVISPHWVQSYPRPRHLAPQVKVLPERIPPLRLRTTDNGAILQNGGTISGRKQSITREERIYRPRSSSAHRPPRPEDITLEKTRFGSEPDLRFPKEARDQFAENAIRQRISRSRKKYKAPPAPPNGSGMDSSPDLNGWDSHNPDYTPSGRKARLFKTRAETNKKNFQGPKKQENADADERKSNEAPIIPRTKIRDDIKAAICEKKERNERMEGKPLVRSTSHEAISSRRNLATPEFQAELLEAAQRLKPKSAQMLHQTEGSAATGTTPSKERPKSSIYQSRNSENSKENDNYQSCKPKSQNDVVKGRSRQENLSPTHKADARKVDKTERDVPSKKFYFGMEENNNDVSIVNSYASTNNVDKTNAEHRMTAVEKSKNLKNLYRSGEAEQSQEWEKSLEKFAATYHKTPVVLPNGNTTSCSSSFVSDPDEDVDGGIALQLRPTLPKKQLEIPRFSPTTAWRLLSSIDTYQSTAASPACSDDGPLLLEERINAPSQQGLRNSHDKSGDSGISGDASPGGCHETYSELAVNSAKTLAAHNTKNLLMTWTPQQDLEEESSSEDLESPVSSSKNVASNMPGAKFSPRGQLFSTREQTFSLSLPRDESLGHFTETEEFKGRSGSMDHSSKFNSLKKLKAALATSKRIGLVDENTLNQDGNWVLSRSVPSSLNNSGHATAMRSISNPSSPEQDEESIQQALSLKYPSYSYLATGGRMMYLPEYHSRLSPDTSKKHGNMRNSALLSKSCENISSSEMRQIRRTPSPVVSQNIQNTEERYRSGEVGGSCQKKKKFTFQSTVRLIENKRLADKLSREAELKENQRLSELEAMKKVEEEFQKKRAREKANIRHQLRLFSLEEKNCYSLPPIDWGTSRAEPDGAPNSLPPASTHVKNHNSRKTSAVRKISGLGEGSNKYTPITQVLSEYREPMRDYRDYRLSRYHEVSEPPSDPHGRSIVEHPRVVYDIPKNTAVYVSALSAQNQCYDVEARGLATPRSSSSDNYRKDFAHGALPLGGRSLASSDSELSQSHTRPTSRQCVLPQKLTALQRSRSASPESLRSLSPDVNRCSRSSSSSPLRSLSASPSKMTPEERSSSRTPESLSNRGDPAEMERAYTPQLMTSANFKRDGSASPNLFSAGKSLDNSYLPGRGMSDNTQDLLPVTTSDLPRIGLSSLQPFKKAEKSFRPISFNPMNNKLAQPVN